MSEKTDVLIVGAGPTGLTLAAGLLSRGVRVRVIDRAERASPHSKAITLWPRSFEVFETLGAGRELYDRGVKLAATNYYTGDRHIGRLRMRPLAGTRFPVPVSLPQVTTEEVLREAVGRHGGRIEFGSRLESFTQDDDGVTARLADGTEIRAGWLVGCDGAHSTVREGAGVSFEGATYPQSFVLVDGEYDTEYVHDESYYVMGRTGVIVVAGLPDGLYRFFASVPPGVEVEDAEAAVARAVAENSPLRADSVKVAGSGVFRIHRKLADRMRVGRVLLAGDAAHIHSPAGGLGLNTGVQDSGSLAWRLAAVVRRGLDEAELDAWQEERLFVAHGVVTEADQQTRMWLLRGWRRWLRDVGITLGLRTGVIERVLPRRMAQLDLVLPVQGPAAGRLRSGSRLPDVPVTGRGQYLYDLLGDGHLLLAAGDEGAGALPGLGLPADVDPEVLRIVTVPAHGAQSLGVPRRALCLVRPDGVVAAAAAPSDRAAVEALRARLLALVAPAPAESRAR
ncbi:FAD-dependent monooxygenase [Streptomyces sp. NPDC001833]|uniref:FAD-dependent monooxygenase n=1 Tax=Streptomyces sp. NPDC001833 TaxID=3154658 RepID=UPI00332F20A5